MALRDLFVKIKGDKTQLDSTLKGAGQSINSFGGVVKKLGGIIAAAFGVREIINFTKEAVNLAAEAEGVKKAFEKIGSPEVMGQLKKATRGLFDDADLSAFAVKATNLGIPLKDLAKYLEFATNRAITTGKSVNDLSEAIIMGIGRQSSRSLIQLGISVTDLQKGIKDTGSFTQSVGAIIDREMKNMGDVVETTAVKTQRLAVAWSEVKESFGAWITQTNAFKSSLKWIQDELEIFQDKDLSFWQKINGSPNEYAQWKKNQDEAQKTINENTNKLFPSLIDGLKKVNDETVATSQAAALLAAQQAEAAKKAQEEAAAQYELAAALKAAKQAAGGAINPITNLKPSVNGGSKRDPEVAAIAQKWVNDQLVSSGGNNLRPGPSYDKSTAAKNQAIQDMIDSQEKLDEYMGKVEDTLRQGVNMATDLGAEFIGALGEAIGGGNMQDIGKNLLLSFANFMSTFGKMLITLGVGMAAFQESLKNLFANPLVAIAAGVALIAVAGIIKGSAQKAASGVSSGGSGGGSGGGYSSSGNLQNVTVKVEGVLKGKDIYIVSKRYVSDLNSSS